MKNKANKKLPTLSIGIPAYNEEENIEKLIISIFKQTHIYFDLKSVIIISDGSTDRTNSIIRKFKKIFSEIKIVERTERLGKANALNLIYKLSNSDFLLTIDADVVFLGFSNLDAMIREMVNNPSLRMVGPLHIPTSTKFFFGNLSRFSYLIFRDAALKIDEGNNFYSSMTSQVLKKILYKSFYYPPGTVSDQCYVYAVAIKNGKKGFKLVKDAKVVFGVAQTFHDWRVLSTRSVVGDKADIIKHFGRKVLKDYSMSRKLYILSLIKYFFINPIYAVGAVLMNIYIRKFPYRKRHYKRGLWEMVTTSKEVIL